MVVIISRTSPYKKPMRNAIGPVDSELDKLTLKLPPPSRIDIESNAVPTIPDIIVEIINMVFLVVVMLTL